MSKRSFSDLEAEVIRNELCTSCGTCIGVCPQDALDVHGLELEPYLVNQDLCSSCGICYQSCPGKGVPYPQIEEYIFGKKRRLDDPLERVMGVYRQCYASHAQSDLIRSNGASGGSTTALLSYCLDAGVLDAVITSVGNPDKPWQSKPIIVTKSADLVQGQQSKYTVIPVNSIFSEVIKMQIQKVGMVGLPCHIQGLRYIQLNKTHKKLANVSFFVLGLLCATTCYTSGVEHFIGEKLGVELDKIATVKYRSGKWPGSLKVVEKNGKEHYAPQRDYKYGFLTHMYSRSRCELCWDFAADLADISLGDIYQAPWPLPEGGPGWNSMIIRSAYGEKIAQEAQANGYLNMVQIDPKYILSLAGWERKKHSNTLRLNSKREKGLPVPDVGYPDDDFKTIFHGIHIQYSP